MRSDDCGKICLHWRLGFVGKLHTSPTVQAREVRFRPSLAFGLVKLLKRRVFRQSLVLVAAMAAITPRSAPADVLNMPAGQTSLQFVTVGDPGNAADPSTGYGAVPYSYQIGKYDVTIGQYVQFLNAVARTDPYGVYNPMQDSYYPKLAIVQSGVSGSYRYSIAGGYNGDSGAATNCPIYGVSWGDAARFCNWLQNGQPTGAEGSGTTETGAYTLNGASPITRLGGIRRNAGAKYFLPSENEWYKAAYYKGGGTNAGYWLYPTRSDTPPSNVLSATGTNNANFYDGGYTIPQMTLRLWGLSRHRQAPMARMTWAATSGSGTRRSSAATVVACAAAIVTSTTATWPLPIAATTTTAARRRTAIARKVSASQASPSPPASPCWLEWP